MPSPYGAGAPKTDGAAIAALVCGIAGFFCVIPAILAIILGYSSKKRIDRSGGLLGGRGMAQAGIVLGIVTLVLGVLAFILIASSDT